MRRRRVRAMGRFGDQADPALRLAARGMPAAYRQQAGIFALRSGVGLQADAGIARGLREPGAQLLIQF